jgi:4-amino-4-deoxy-L-arabinose transferase-like glycosyltransferase
MSQSIPARPNPLARASMLALLLIAFVLRAYHLDYQSFWSDEGISLVRANLPLGEMLAQMPVEHVPGYFVLLRGWIALTGTHDFGIRYLSLLPSVWAVALIYRLAVDLGSQRVGLLAALLLTANPFQVWYAQEARMYSWLLATGLLSTIACWRLFTRPSSWGTWVTYVLAITCTVYLHFFGFLVPLSHAAWAIVWLISGRQRQELWRWAGAGIMVALLFAPWAMRALELLSFEGWREPLDPTRVPWLLLQAYTVGEQMPAPWLEWLPWLYALFALLGLVAWSYRRGLAGVFLGTLLAMALVVVWLLVVRQSDFHVRYPIFISAPLLLLAAGGIAALDPGWWRGATSRLGIVLPGLVTVGLLSASGMALQRIYTEPSLHKPNFRDAAATINREVNPTDVVLVDGPNPQLVFAHYYNGPAPVHDLRDLEGKSYEEVNATLTAATQNAARAWELLYFHTPGPVQFWMATHGWAAAATDHNGIRVTLYGLDHKPLVEQQMDVAFGPGLTLYHAGVGGPSVQRSDLVRVTTRWQVDAPLPEYKFSLRLATPDGQVILADDYVPQNWFAPTSQWVMGSIAVDQRALFLPADLPPGPYMITLRLYDPTNGVAVESASGQDVLLGTIEVVP